MGANNILLAGSQLKNTDEVKKKNTFGHFRVDIGVDVDVGADLLKKINLLQVWAVAVYTGKETKMALNTKITNNKFSTVENSLNRLLLFLCALLILEVSVSTALTLTFGVEYLDFTNIDGTSFLWFPLRYSFADVTYLKQDFEIVLLLVAHGSLAS